MVTGNGAPDEVTQERCVGTVTLRRERDVGSERRDVAHARLLERNIKNAEDFQKFVDDVGPHLIKSCANMAIYISLYNLSEALTGRRC